MMPVYSRYIDNFAQLRLQPELDYTARVRYLVIAHTNWSSNSLLVDSLLGWIEKRGYDVRVTVRNPRELCSFGIFDGFEVEVFEADMRDSAAMRRAMDGVSGVFQVAALYNYDEQSLNQGIVANNLEGSLTVLKVAKACQVGRVLFTSSIAAVGFGGTRERPLTEACWSDPTDPYCRSKLGALVFSQV